MERRFGDGPEEDSTEGVKTETGNDGDLVALALKDFTSDGRVAEVTDTEVSDLKPGRLELGDAEDVLEVLVEDIEKTCASFIEGKISIAWLKKMESAAGSVRDPDWFLRAKEGIS